MMKAEVTAENRPAWDPSQHISIQEIRKTHEDQRCVKILVVSLVEFLVVFLGDLAVVPKKPSPKLLRSG